MTSRNFEDTESLKDLCAQIEHIVIDTDGVLTDGTFQYSRFGKTLKTFGSHDGRALQIAKKFFDIQMISADLRGIKITKSRARDLNIPCTYVSENERKSWIESTFHKDKTALIADSFSDIPSIGAAVISFAPNNAHPAFLERASVKLSLASGSGAVSEAMDILLFNKHSIHLWECLDG